jgi:hypothetical protein
VESVSGCLALWEPKEKEKPAASWTAAGCALH